MDNTSIDISTDIARLATLSVLAYDRAREFEAKRLGLRLGILDAEVASQRRSVAISNPGVAAPDFSDESLALAFTEQHADRLRYVGAWGRWFIFDRAVWREDQTMQAFDLARAVCREAAARANDPTERQRLASASTVAAVERLAKSDRRHAGTVDDWDADPWLLNTPGGVIDLRTGESRQHRASDRMTKMTAVPLGDDCPTWRAFLARVTAEDQELQLFLQRMAGYALTGITREHALFFAYGTGGNGKGVFLNTLTGIMASYAAVASMETFTAANGSQHPTDLAMLRGARLVTAQETEEGRRWAESRIKSMTGGDPITARFMRQDFFTFQPQFKLAIAGNHKPGLRNVDEAMRRRFNLLPFTVTIGAAERDPDLPNKLRAEWPGILRWMLDGCLLWQDRGLEAPASVRSATEEYLQAEDTLAGWLDECCILGKNLHVAASALYGSWEAWAKAAGEFAGPQKRFSQALTSRGFQPARMTGGRSGFRGIGLKPTSRYGSE